MSGVALGHWYFDHSRYDREQDVLYLSIGEPRPGHGEETPEGHILRFDEEGEVCGVTLVGIQQLLDAGNEVGVTLPPPPRRERVVGRDLRHVLA